MANPDMTIGITTVPEPTVTKRVTNQSQAFQRITGAKGEVYRLKPGESRDIAFDQRSYERALRLTKIITIRDPSAADEVAEQQAAIEADALSPAHEAEVERLNSEIDSLNSQISGLSDQVTELNEELTSTRAERDGLKDELSAARMRVAELENQTGNDVLVGLHTAHKGGGVYVILNKDDVEEYKGLDKAGADAFNDLSDADKTARLRELTAQ